MTGMPGGPRLYEIVARALEADAAQRRRVVEEACGADTGLRDRVLAVR